MNSALRRDILQWDVRNWSKALEFWENNTDWSKVHDCLELGARAGGPSLWLALRGRTVTCSDVDDSHLAARRQLHAKYNVAEAIHYANVDAVEIPYRDRFDLIVMKSVLGGVRTLPDTQTLRRVVDGIFRALRPGGQFLFAENTDASPLHQYFRRKLGRHESWRYVSVDEIRELLRDFSSLKLETAGVAATFGRTEGQRTILSNLDSLALERICPPSWRYLAYGVATK